MFTQALTIAALAGLATANSVPIFGSYPGWVATGGNQLSIEIEIFMDFLCSDAKAAYPTVKQMLDSKLTDDLTVREAALLKVSSFPLDYHLHSWQVAQVLPYLLDDAAISQAPRMNQYLDIGFQYQDTVLGKDDMSKEEFIPYWSKIVSDELSLDYDTMLGIYDRENDKHNTEDKTRAIWKYGSAKGVSGTPTAFVNGVKLDSFPATVDEWI